jgi:hypothetical protein
MSTNRARMRGPPATAESTPASSLCTGIRRRAALRREVGSPARTRRRARGPRVRSSLGGEERPPSLSFGTDPIPKMSLPAPGEQPRARGSFAPGASPFAIP